MRKRLSIVLVLFLSVTLLLGSTVEATPGKLTSSSIEKCGKTLWGYHNKTRRHWHKAVYHKNSGYYALDWSHEYKRVKKCSYKLSNGKKAKKKTVAHKVSRKAVKKYKSYGYAKYKNKWYKVKYNKKKRAWYTSGKSLGTKKPKQIR